MQINLSEETIKIVCDVLEGEQRHLVYLICNEKYAGPERRYRNRLAKVENALQVFEELSQ